MRDAMPDTMPGVVPDAMPDAMPGVIPGQGVVPDIARPVPPEETWRRIRPLLPRLGVTRVADITGLDTIGIPVAIAYRPNSRSLAVSQGKGPSTAAAMVSAAMEAIEHAHAERIDAPLRLARAAELDSAVAPWLLPRTEQGSVDEHTPVLWLTGWRVGDGAPVAVPYEAVSLDFTLPRGMVPLGLCRDSNGLAGGNTPDEAVVHGLCELIERDAAALWDLLPAEDQAATRIDAATVDHPGALELLERYSAAGVEAALFDITSDVGVPAVLCQIVEAEPDPFRPLPPAGGLGCHPDPGHALVRALAEAAQSRLIGISGSRDDVTRDEYDRVADVEAAVELRDALRATQAYARPWRSGRACPPGPETLGDVLAWLLDRLAAAGLPEVAAVDLTRPGLGIPVVKVLVPGLEGAGALTGAPVLPGPRAARLLAEADGADEGDGADKGDGDG
ncbi:ribosomal protein S12 methylthiotransferase accessory factor [Thermocatellispora tengchongensis]|uniref:Ribosomal protein S12 methylthiotransferase accessory factor n=1 Tax=Thermocatellispora tengchongensis TaxID=1073253 RepID=A0A840P136_9ACTN|nr:YcaO-like family protein [Thermocatellispora tengchongensis]MBB5134964.1 ribosomal protein S12 methylthiotransferase accessory factor [Thermocatellispora tengchongensis]